MTNDKASPGKRLGAVRASTWNSMVMAGEQFEQRRLGEGGAPFVPPSHRDVIKVRNLSGENLVRGEVLSIVNSAVETIDRNVMWFDGEKPKHDINQDRFAILLNPSNGISTSDGEIVDAQISGVCIGHVDIKDQDHRFARINHDDTTLESSWAGPVEILWMPDETGLFDCIVRIDRHGAIPVLKTPAGGIPARSGIRCGKADCVPHYINADGDLVEMLDADENPYTVEVLNIFASAVSGDAFITAKQSTGRLIADAEDCD